MRAGKFVFAQLMEFLPWKRFQRLVIKYEGSRYVKYFSRRNRSSSCCCSVLKGLPGAMSHLPACASRTHRASIVTLSPSSRATFARGTPS